ncbi:MarR family winged helix-turn-helix transcriptional regulator [Actinopolymorpha pittospori]
MTDDQSYHYHGFVSPDREATQPKHQVSQHQASGQPSPRLGYLLKHAHLRFIEVTRDALAPLGVDSRQWAALLCLGDQEQRAQAEVAHLLGVDRTTMVALVDDLEARGLVRRRPHRDDRRKNVVELTAAGRDIARRGARRIDDAERRFLAPLDEREAQQLKGALASLLETG